MTGAPREKPSYALMEESSGILGKEQFDALGEGLSGVPREESFGALGEKLFDTLVVPVIAPLFRLVFAVN